MWLGDDFHHNGPFRLSYAFEYAYSVDGAKGWQDFALDRYDTYAWYLRLGPLATVNERFFRGNVPTWNGYATHPDYDAFWQKQTMIPHICTVTVPTLKRRRLVGPGGLLRPGAHLRDAGAFDTRHLNYLVVGPWNHRGWTRGTGERLGAIAFGSATSTYFRDEVQAPWFAYYLKDAGRLDLPEALTFEAGTNRWRLWGAWPPKASTEDRALYLRANEMLSFDKPTDTGETAFDAYVSDPAFPVPYRQRPIQATYFPGGSTWPAWLVEDQRFVDDRADVISWDSTPLEKDLAIAGEVVAHLFASTSGSDADWA